MSAEPFENFLKKVYARYNRNPVGWKVLLGSDDKGFPTILFLSPEELWELKLDSLYKPNPICVGSKVTDSIVKVEREPKSPSYGFRPVDDERAKLIIESLSKKEMPSDIVRKILLEEPKPLSEIEKRKMVLHGPIIHSPRLPLLSEQQVDLDVKLRRELQRILSNRGIGAMYS
ncbi:MAG: hypothetical protein ACUVQ8_04550 [Nitrososphaeria archaeon]